jgi:hemerythrin-like domain-containing protein
MNADEFFEAIRAFGEHEHRELARGLDRIHAAGCAIGTGLKVDDARSIRDVLRWSDATLQPHIDWEESWLFPQIDDLTRTPWSTRTARFDHAQIHGLIHRLRRDEELAASGLTPTSIDEVRCDLFAYEALLRAHVDREEQLLLPVLTDAAALADDAAVGVTVP